MKYFRKRPLNLILLLNIFLYSYYLWFILLSNKHKLPAKIEPKNNKDKVNSIEHLIIKYVFRAIRYNFLINKRYCLFRSLLIFRYLRMYGYFPEFNVGIGLENKKVNNLKFNTDMIHCWVTLKDINVSDKNTSIQVKDKLVEIDDIIYWVISTNELD